MSTQWPTSCAIKILKVFFFKWDKKYGVDTCFLSWSVVLSSPGIVSLMQILAGSVQGVTQRHSEEIQG